MITSPIAALLVLIVVVLGAFAMALIPESRELTDVFLPEHVEMFTIRDTTGQRLGYTVALLAIATFAVAGTFGATHTLAFNRSRGGRVLQRTWRTLTRQGGWVALIAVLALLPDYSSKKLMYLLIAFLLSGVLCSRAARLRAPSTQAALWGVAIVYLGFWLGAGLLSPIDMTHLGSGEIALVEAHYTAVVGPAGRIAAGHRLLDEVVAPYGLFWASLSGAWQLQFGPSDFATQQRAVQWLQVLFAGFAVAGYAVWRPRLALATLVPVLMLGPVVDTLGSAGVWFPNQSAWRFMAFPAGLLLLVLLRNRPAPTVALASGVGSGLALLNNMETGISLTLGYAVFLVLRSDGLRARRLIVLGAAFVLGWALALAAFALFWRLALGVWPLPASFQNLLFKLTSFGGGYGGRPLYWDPIALLVFLHSAFVLLRTGITWRWREPSADAAFCAAVAATILVWGMYYANRPEGALDMYLVPYGFLVANLLHPRVLGVHGGRFPLVRLPAQTVVLALILGPYVVERNYDAIRHAARNLERVHAELPPSQRTRVDGVWMRPEIGAALESKAALLQTLPERARVVYFTANTHFVPSLTGIYPGISLQDAFSEATTPAELNTLLARTFDYAPSHVLIDAPESVLAAPEPQQHFFERLRKSLRPRYRPVQIASEWELWAPVQTPEAG